MQRTRWKPELKAEALRIVAEEGLAEAARRTGVPTGTVASWASRAGVRTPEVAELRKNVESLQQTVAQRKAGLAEGLLGDIERLRGQLFEDESPALDQQRRMSAITSAITAVQLLSGEATARIETTDLDALKAQAAAVADQLAARRTAAA